jgi:hypothetical protein
MCDECAKERGDSQLCENCESELAELDRINNVPVRERVRRAGVSFRNFLIGLAVLAVLAVPASMVVRNLMSQPITPEEFARFRYAAGGTFETEEGVNTLSTVLGGKVLSATSSEPGYEEKRLIDEYVGPGYPGWRSADATYPQEVVFQLSQPTKIEKINVQQQPTEPRESWMKEFEVQVATASPDGPWRTIGRWSMEQTDEIQRYQFDAVDAYYVKLRVLSNYGGPYVSLGEFDAYILPRGPFGLQPTAAVTGTPGR